MSLTMAPWWDDVNFCNRAQIKALLSQLIQTNWTLGWECVYICIYTYMHIFMFSFFLSFPLIRVQFVMWQKTFLWSMFHLNTLASCLCLIKPRWCKIKFLSCQWRFKWGSFLCTFHAYSSILSICVICNKTVEEKKA